MINIEPVKIEDAEELLSIYAPYVRDTAVSFEYDCLLCLDFKTEYAIYPRFFPT